MSSDRLLHHERIEPEGPVHHWLLVLHGIFGQGRNWRSIAKRLAAEHGVGVVLADLRAHGQSRHLGPPYTLAAAAQDVVRLINALSVSGLTVQTLAGHSFGGKVALQACATEPKLVPDLVVLDSTPSAGAVRSEGPPWILSRLRAVGSSHANRNAFVKALADEGVPRAIGLWLAMNLEPADNGSGQQRFGLDLDAIESLLESYYRTDLWPAVMRTVGPRQRFVVAGRSDIVDADAQARLETLEPTGRLEFILLPDSGHWVHVDAADRVVEILST